MRHSLATIALCLSLSACQAARRHALEPVRDLRSVDTSLDIRCDAAGLPERAFDFEPATTSSPRVGLQARFLAVSHAQAAELFGARSGSLVALVCSRAEAQRWQSELDSRAHESLEVNRTQLSMVAGQTASIAVCDTSSYVGAFQVESTGDTLVADPQVQIAREGFVLRAQGRPLEGGAIEWELELVMAELERPVGERRIELNGTPVTFQAPSSIVRTLTTRTTLAPDEVLVLGGAALPVPHGKGSLFVVLETGSPAEDQR